MTGVHFLLPPFPVSGEPLVSILKQAVHVCHLPHTLVYWQVSFFPPETFVQIDCSSLRCFKELLEKMATCFGRVYSLCQSSNSNLNLHTSCIQESCQSSRCSLFFVKKIHVPYIVYQIRDTKAWLFRALMI